LEEAREGIATALDRSPHEVVLTSGGTEADQLAVVGTYRAAAAAGQGRHIVCSTVEHPAVRDAVAWLEASAAADVTWVDPPGVAPVDPADVAAAIRADTVLVALTGADGEVGVAQHSEAVARICSDAGVALHTDAVQRTATLPPPTSGALAVTGHKLGAPVGIGAALLPRDVAVAPLVPGPGQERGLRSGTQPTALASALATVLALTVAERAQHTPRSRALTVRLAAGLTGLEDVTPTVAVDDPHRLATHLHLQLGGVDGEALALALDDVGVAVSTGTACATGSAAPSPVLAAYGVTADAVLRCSVGRTTTTAEVDTAAERIVAAVTTLRRRGGGFL
jgi:cysteine desulfurase